MASLFSRNTSDNVRAFIETNSHACAMKDKDSVFIYANTTYARLVGFKHEKDFLGRTDFDLPCGASHCASLFRAQDEDVMRRPHIMRIFDIQQEAEGKWHALFTTKTVFFEEDGKIGGSFFQMKDITSEATLQFWFSLGKSTPYHGESKFGNQLSYIVGSPTHLSLTQRQSQILFFLIRRHSLKKTAIALELPLKTLHHEVEKLKERFKASTITELIDASIRHGCMNLMPRGLSSRQRSVILQAD